MNQRCLYALMASAAFGLCLSTQAAAADASPSSGLSQADVEQYLDENLEAAGSRTAAGMVRSQLPKDYPALRRKLAAALRGGLDGDDFYWLGRQEMDRLYAAHADDLAAAPTASVMALARAEASYVRALQANGPAACAEYAGGYPIVGAPAGDEAAQAALTAADLAHVEAIRAGMDRPQVRAPVAEADTSAWGAALANHEGRKLAGQYLDQSWLADAGQRDLCAATVAYYDGFLALPPESGARMFLRFYGSWRKSASPTITTPDVATEAEARRVVDGWADQADSLQAVLKTSLPTDYKQFVDEIAPLVLAHVDQNEINSRKDRFILTLPQHHLDDIKAAPTDALMTWARTESLYVHASQADGPEACVANVSAVEVDERQDASSETTLLAFHNSFAARLRLIRAGIDAPTQREDVSTADREAWKAGVVKRLGEKRAAERRDAAWRRSVSHKVLCAAEVDVFDALLETPAANAAPLIALKAAGFNPERVDAFLGASQAKAEAAFDAALDTTTQINFATVLKASLPQDYLGYRREMADLLRRGGTAKEASAKAEELIAEVEDRRQREVLASPAPLLADFFAKQVALLRILREEDIGRCAAFMFRGDAAAKPPSARAAKAASESYAAEFKAIRGGMDKPASRPAATEDQLDAWAEAFAMATPARAHQAYLDDSQLANASDEDRCAVAIGFYAAFTQLPDETAGRVFRTLSDEEDDAGPPSVASL